MAKAVLRDKKEYKEKNPNISNNTSIDRKNKSTPAASNHISYKPITALTLALTEKLGQNKENELEHQVENLTQSILNWGSISRPSPVQTIDKTLQRLNFKQLKNVEKNGIVWDLLGTLDQTQIESLETKIAYQMPKMLPRVYSVLAKKNIVGFDGASVALRTSSVSIVYARAGSYGYSQRKQNAERLSFNSGINRIWCDVAPIIPSVPNALVADEGLRQLVIEDFEKKISGQDPVLMAEIEALSRVEAMATILCMEKYGEKINLVFVDGPMYMARDGFKSSLTRANYLQQLGIPQISIVKNLVASPVMKSADQNNKWTDFAFFATALKPGDRSCAFLRHNEGKYLISNPKLNRVFFYYKTLLGDLFRYEMPLWAWELEEERKYIINSCIADSLLAGGGFSFVCSKADQLVRIRKNLRLLLRSSYFAHLKELNLGLCEPFNQKRWGM